MTWLARYFSSMAGRIFLVLALGMALAGSGALLLADAKRRADLDRIHLEWAADGLQNFVTQINAAPPTVREQLARQGTAGVKLAAASARGEGIDPDLSRVLAARLTGASDLKVEHADLTTCRSFDGRLRSPPRGGPDSTFKPPDCWLIGLTLAAGQRVRVALDTPPRLVGENRAFDPLYLAVLCLAAALLALLVARMAAEPLERLSGAARTLGQDLDREPLPETGPLEVRAAAQAFNAMQQRLRQNLAQRTQMLAAITHDLQTPLTRLRLRVEKVADVELRDRLVSDLAAMQALIREGLDLARSGEAMEAQAALDLDSLLESLVEDEAAAGRPVRFLGGCGCDVRVRPQALRRCLANLIDNALAYGDHAEVSATRDGSEVTVRVRDHGPGIPDAELDRVFEPLYRLEGSRSRETGGVGLGLTIARALAERDGGRLTLNNHPETGLEARLTLPLLR